MNRGKKNVIKMDWVKNFCGCSFFLCLRCSCSFSLSSSTLHRSKGIFSNMWVAFMHIVLNVPFLFYFVKITSKKNVKISSTVFVNSSSNHLNKTKTLVGEKMRSIFNKNLVCIWLLVDAHVDGFRYFCSDSIPIIITIILMSIFLLIKSSHIPIS